VEWVEATELKSRPEREIYNFGGMFALFAGRCGVGASFSSHFFLFFFSSFFLLFLASLPHNIRFISGELTF
jgi:hypothetical protein